MVMGAQLVIPLSPSGGLHYYTIGGGWTKGNY